MRLLIQRYGDPCEVVDAYLHRITNWPQIKEKDLDGFERLADALQAAVFALDRPDYKHELLSVPLYTQFASYPRWRKMNRCDKLSMSKCPRKLKV